MSSQPTGTDIVNFSRYRDRERSLQQHLSHRSIFPCSGSGIIPRGWAIGNPHPQDVRYAGCPGFSEPGEQAPNPSAQLLRQISSADLLSTGRSQTDSSSGIGIIREYCCVGRIVIVDDGSAATIAIPLHAGSRRQRLPAPGPDGVVALEGAPLLQPGLSQPVPAAEELPHGQVDRSSLWAAAAGGSGEAGQEVRRRGAAAPGEEIDHIQGNASDGAWSPDQGYRCRAEGQGSPVGADDGDEIGGEEEGDVGDARAHQIMEAGKILTLSLSNRRIRLSNLCPKFREVTEEDGRSGPRGNQRVLLLS